MRVLAPNNILNHTFSKLHKLLRFVGYALCVNTNKLRCGAIYLLNYFFFVFIVIFMMPLILPFILNIACILFVQACDLNEMN